MIRSFRNTETEQLFNRQRARAVPNDIQRRVYRKLRQIHASTSINDLRTPPGNRLEALSGSREGQHSIRVNDQWRICFRWDAGHAYDVEVVDYHL
ncbi:MAG: type II toxin-antitoxin system RelE/ParE family toxin [bacterium]